MNTDELEAAVSSADYKVRGMQTKLHRWAREDPHRRFDDLFNLVTDPAFLMVAWNRVRGNKGARTAGVDGWKVAHIEAVIGVEDFLGEVRNALRGRTFQPVHVREVMIPKTNGKLRRLGIPTVVDRVVQASLKLVLEPTFEADFSPCSYGFRPNRRAHDAIAEARHYAKATYEWVVEGDITACFDEISHSALMARVRERIGDKHVISLVKAFLKAGILSEEGISRESVMGTPQGGILSPLLANVALSVLDEFFDQHQGGHRSTEHGRRRRKRLGEANYRLVRYADDFLILVSGDRHHAERVKDEVAKVLQPMGLRLSEEKTLVTHIDNGLDFLGWRIQRHRKRGTNQHYIYTYPAKKSLRSIMVKVKTMCRRMDTGEPLDSLLRQLNPTLRGWCAYFRPGVSNATFNYLASYTWWQVIRWIRRKHRDITWRQLRRIYCGGEWWITSGERELFHSGRVATTRYRYRGTKIPTPWESAVG
ncbi:group II intron reverse transcriptase/maturase [Actinoplanes awajinensis subsp. mycoplanecinus]|uniref:Group II intron reverse transcriptase/maturase n=2 Tax=Actinoplanes awajinensis TaxID=135946 RepID=A0A0X3UVE2_9ACTN|nr:group II intron reverse transcriptase/maturase [Actinoplanes awajinensis subsp. mycoplanecinus]